MASWWGSKLRQTRSHLAARVGERERRDLQSWLAPEQLALFDRMHRADQRHGLDVVAYLEAHGEHDPELLLAGLLHDAAKGRDVGLGPRIAWALVDHYGPVVRRFVVLLPGYGPALERLDHHAELSAAAATEAGCSPRTVALIRSQGSTRGDTALIALRRADEAC